MNDYEGMVIFPEALNEEALEEAVAAVKTEMERLGGRMQSTTRLGKRSFARPMKKEKAGHYVVFGFQLEGDRVQPLRERFKLMPQVFRAQILRAIPVTEGAAAEAETKETADGIA